MRKARSSQARPDQGNESCVAGDQPGPHATDPSPPGIGSHAPREGDRAITSSGMLAVRITWFAVGPVALFLVSATILGSASGWLTVLDAVFWALVGLMVWCRWVDQRSGVAVNAFGEPATWEDFRRYAVFLSLVALVVWIVVNGLGNHILGT